MMIMVMMMMMVVMMTDDDDDYDDGGDDVHDDDDNDIADCLRDCFHESQHDSRKALAKRKAIGNQHTSHIPVSWFCYAQNRVCCVEVMVLEVIDNDAL